MFKRSIIKVFIPNNNLKEREYIINVILSEFLGLKYNLKAKNIQDYEIILENGNKLIVEDHFFNKFPRDLEYLNKRNIPKKVKFGKNEFIVERDIPIIYGSDKIGVKNNQIICGIDIFASSFFMLSRWEEYVNKRRDNHNRFPATASIAYKFNFLYRPIVNEYVEMLWNFLNLLGCKQKRKIREFKFIFTHDVDVALKYGKIIQVLKIVGGDILKRHNLKSAFQNSIEVLRIYMKLQKDPFDTYNYLIDFSERLGGKSYFFLHSSSSAREDFYNGKLLKIIAKKIKKRGHYLGYHPSYNAYNNLELFLEDKYKIEQIVEEKLESGRQHYLRFEVPATWQIWEDGKMKWDSTLSYADNVGFRCGTCYPFPVFNILERKKLNLYEKPLIIMDCTLFDYQKLTLKKAKILYEYLINKVKQFKGEFVLLWHNSYPIFRLKELIDGENRLFNQKGLPRSN